MAFIRFIRLTIFFGAYDNVMLTQVFRDGQAENREHGRFYGGRVHSKPTTPATEGAHWRADLCRASSTAAALLVNLAAAAAFLPRALGDSCCRRPTSVGANLGRCRSGFPFFFRAAVFFRCARPPPPGFDLRFTNDDWD
jgi:hypothetical protein